jgi:hypothetical protein
VQDSLRINIGNKENNLRIDTHYYDVPTTLAKRSTSLGYGNKISLAAIDNEIPPPTKYTIRSEFSPDRRTGASFGYGREVNITFIRSM